MDSGEWRKLHLCILHDEKCRLLSDGHWRVFVSMIALGCRDKDRAGELLWEETRRPMSMRDLSDEIGVSLSALARALKRLMEWKMVARVGDSKGRFPATLKVVNFGKYQTLRTASGTEARCVPPAVHNEADNETLRTTSGTLTGTQSEPQPPTKPQECASEAAPKKYDVEVQPLDVLPSPRSTTAIDDVTSKQQYQPDAFTDLFHDIQGRLQPGAGRRSTIRAFAHDMGPDEAVAIRERWLRMEGIVGREVLCGWVCDIHFQAMGGKAATLLGHLAQCEDLCKAHGARVQAEAAATERGEQVQSEDAEIRAYYESEGYVFDE